MYFRSFGHDFTSESVGFLHAIFSIFLRENFCVRNFILGEKFFLRSEPIDSNFRSAATCFCRGFLNNARLTVKKILVISFLNGIFMMFFRVHRFFLLEFTLNLFFLSFCLFGSFLDYLSVGKNFYRNRDSLSLIL